MLIPLLFFLFGLCLGSFVNVCIYRLPRGLSIVFPASFCPSCGYKIPFYLNIPIISYLILSGKCRNCKAKIPLRYPITELITGIAVLCLFLKVQKFTFLLFFLIFFFAVLIIISGIDFEHKIIPDILSIGLTSICVIYSPFNGFLTSPIHFLNPAISKFSFSTLSIIICVVSLMLLRIVGNHIFKKESLGIGDIKLCCAISAMFGIKGFLFSLFFGSIIATFVSLFLILLKKFKFGEHLSFGPFLSLGIFLYFMLLLK